jgi:hypothetical protein
MLDVFTRLALAESPELVKALLKRAPNCPTCGEPMKLHKPNLIYSNEEYSRMVVGESLAIAFPFGQFGYHCDGLITRKPSIHGPVGVTNYEYTYCEQPRQDIPWDVIEALLKELADASR